jgi:hypothetical protein
VAPVRLLLAAAGILSAIGTGASGSPGVQTLYRNAHGPITSFAQDGQLLAWFSTGSDGCNAVHIFSLGGVVVRLPKPGTTNVTCRWTIGTATVGLAIAATNGSALWTLEERASVDLDYVVGAQVRDPRERRFSQLAHTDAGAGLWLGGVAGDGRTLVYSSATVGYVNQVACLSGGSCRRRIVGGGVHRVVGRRNPLVPGTRAALQVAAGGGRIAYIRAGGVSDEGRPIASASLPVDVRTAATGALVARVEPAGVPLALALSANRLALLTRSSGRLQVTWYVAATGRRLGAVRMPPGTSPQLTASDRVVVYRVGRVIGAIDLTSHRAHKLVRAAATPIGLSIEGTRVAWAENVKGTGRIRALYLRAG